MSDTIPYHIQAEIIKNLPIKSLVRFRLVSKQWKSLIESSKFIACYRAQQKHKHHLLVRYGQASDNDSDVKYVSIVDDDTFPQHKVSLTVPTSLNLLYLRGIVSSQGLLFVHGDDRCSGTSKALIWNPTIRKSVDIDVCCADTGFGYKMNTYFCFGVCPDTCDPKIVKFTYIYNSKKWVFEVLTLSTHAWRRLSKNLPREYISLTYNQVTIDRFMYWLAYEPIYEDEGYYEDDEYHDDDGYSSGYTRDLIVSFDMKSEEFTEIFFPASLAVGSSLHLYNIRDSLVVVQLKYEAEKQIYSVWKMMEPGVSNSFTKLYNINTTHVIRNIHGFRKSGEPIAETENNPYQTGLFAYDPDSNHINYIGIPGARSYYSVNSYIETLLLLDH